MSMYSRFHGGGSLSSTEAAQKFPLFSPTGIRAPLTIDDSDCEYSVSTSGQKGSGFSSDSGFESDGFVSGEDEFEIASDRPFVAHPNDEVLQETDFVEEYVFSRPFVKNPNGKIYEESSNDGEFEELMEDNGSVKEYSDCWPFVADIDEDTMGTPVEEDENVSLVELPVVDIGIALPPKQGIPIAQLSRDSDDDSMEDEIVEDESFSGVLRVQSSRVFERSGNAPKVRVLEVEDEEMDDSVSQTDHVLEAEVVDESIVDASVDEIMDSSNEGKFMAPEKIEHGPMSAEVIVDTCPSTTGEVKCAEMNEESQELDRNSFILCSDVTTMPDPANLTNKESNYLNTNVVTEEDEYSNTVATDSARVVEELLPSEPIESELPEVDNINNFKALSIDGETWRYKSADVDGTVVLSLSSDNDELVSENEQYIDQKVESHDNDGPRNIAYIDGSTMENEVHGINHAELSEGTVAQRSECFWNDHVAEVTGSLFKEDEVHRQSKPEATFEIENDSIQVEEDQDLLPYDDTESIILEGSKEVNAKEQLEQLMASDSLSHTESSWHHLQAIDAEVVRDLEDELNVHTNLEADVLSSIQLAGLGSTVHSLRPTTQPNHLIFSPPPEVTVNGESKEVFKEQDMKKLEKSQQIRAKFLRLLHRLNQSPEDSVASKVVYQLLFAVGRPPAQAFSFDLVKMATELEAEGSNDLDFSLNILIIGKSGVGKSSTVNSIFDEDKATTNAFEPGTTSVKEIKGTLEGIQVRVLDTPGLRSSTMEQSFNRKVLLSIKKFTKKFPPDVVLYVDRLDLQSSGLNDLPLLKSVTSYLGSSIWSHTIVTLTHAASTPPDGPSGNTLSYELYVAQRMHAVRQLISHSVGDLHILNPALIPVSLVENHPVHEMHQNNQSLLCTQESWRSKLLLLCSSMKILSEIDSLATPKLDHRKFSGSKVRPLPQTYFLSSLLQHDAHPKLSSVEGGKNVDSDTELAYSSDCDQESEDEYDQLPPFKPPRKSQIAKRNKYQRQAYFEEYNYDGVNIEDNLAIAGHIPAAIFVGLIKDKKQFNIHLHFSVSGEKGSNFAVLDVDTLREQLAYILNTQTKMRNLKGNKSAAGLSITFAGPKLKDQIAVGKHLLLVGSTGIIWGENDAAYGANLGFHLQEKDYPITNGQSIFGISLMSWRGGLIWGLNLQSGFSRGRNSRMDVRVGLNSKNIGKISVGMSSSDDSRIAMIIGLLPIAKTIFRSIFRSQVKDGEHTLV